MATKLYLQSSGTPDPSTTPAFNGGWTDTSIAVRLPMQTTKQNTGVVTTNFTDAVNTQQDILFYQFLSPLLSAGQTITGSQTVSFVIRASEVSANNNLFLTWALYVFNDTTLKKTIVTKKIDGTELATSLTSRIDSTTSAPTNYTTVAGDRLVLEVGVSGDPSGGNDHDSSMSVNDNNGTDLSADGTTLTFNPNLNLNDTLTFSALFTQSLPATAGNSTSLSKQLGYVKTLSASGVGTVSLSRFLSLLKTLSASGVGSATLATLKTILQTLSATAVGSTVLQASLNIIKAMQATAVGVASMSQSLIYNIILSATAVGVATLERFNSFLKSLSASAGNSVSITKALSLLKTLSASAVSVASISTLKTILQTLQASAVGVATLSTLKTILKTLSASATGIATLVKGFIVSVQMSATAVGVATLGKVKTIVVLLSATASHVVSLTAQFIDFGFTIYYQSLEASATVISSLSKTLTINKILSATAQGVVSITRAIQVSVHMVATAVTSVFLRILNYARQFPYSQTSQKYGKIDPITGRRYPYTKRDSPFQ